MNDDGILCMIYTMEIYYFTLLKYNYYGNRVL